jgi:hypothetical protein
LAGGGRPPRNPPRKYPIKGEAPRTFEVALDFDEGTLAFIIDGEYQGVAFNNLKGKVADWHRRRRMWSTL